MRISDILNELTFQGSKCTTNCSGHSAGYAWSKQHNGTAPCGSTSPSFNRGCEIAKDQMAAGKMIRPKVRDVRGRFSQNPRGRANPQKPVAPTQPI